eukprot:5002507-Amphidinium_carterae.1
MNPFIANIQQTDGKSELARPYQHALARHFGTKDKSPRLWSQVKLEMAGSLTVKLLEVLVRAALHLQSANVGTYGGVVPSMCLGAHTRSASSCSEHHKLCDPEGCRSAAMSNTPQKGSGNKYHSPEIELKTATIPQKSRDTVLLFGDG